MQDVSGRHSERFTRCLSGRDIIMCRSGPERPIAIGAFVVPNQVIPEDTDLQKFQVPLEVHVYVFVHARFRTRSCKRVCMCVCMMCGIHDRKHEFTIDALVECNELSSIPISCPITQSSLYVHPHAHLPINVNCFPGVSSGCIATVQTILYP